MGLYQLYGLTIATECVLPALRARATTPVDVWFEISADLPAYGRDLADSETWYASDARSEDDLPLLEIRRLADGTSFRFNYADGNEFLIETAIGKVWATPRRAHRLEETLSYFLGPVLGFLLRLRGSLCLHASVVSIEGRAIALLGDSGAGKSTTAAAFARLGFPVMSDDIAVIAERGDEIWVDPGYPYIRLWPESVALLNSLSTDKPPLPPAPDGGRLHLDLRRHGYPFQSEAQRLVAVYLLNDSSDAEGPEVTSVSPSESLVSLLGNTYAGRLLGKTRRNTEFQQVGRCASRLPVRKVCAPDDPVCLFELCEAIRRDAQRCCSELAISAATAVPRIPVGHTPGDQRSSSSR